MLSSQRIKQGVTKNYKLACKTVNIHCTMYIQEFQGYLYCSKGDGIKRMIDFKILVKYV